MPAMIITDPCRSPCSTSRRRRSALLPHSPTPYIALMLAGFAIGILGHLSRARWLVAAGVILIFLGALLFPLLANVTTEDRRRRSKNPAATAANRRRSSFPGHRWGKDERRVGSAMGRLDEVDLSQGLGRKEEKSG